MGGGKKRGIDIFVTVTENNILGKAFRMIDDPDFARLLTACNEVSQQYPDGVVYIGGIAVYLHAVNNDAARPYAETTHDADFYISLADMGDLRDAVEVTPNRRLSKHQMIRDDFEFDIYTERQSSLIVPYDEVLAHCKQYGESKVAGLEHLLALKLEAYRDRKASSKGDKDAKDIYRIALLASMQKPAFNWALVEPYITPEHERLLDAAYRSPVASAMARGNAKTAKALRQYVADLIASRENQHDEGISHKP
jgi:hypothetical protein